MPCIKLTDIIFSSQLSHQWQLVNDAKTNYCNSHKDKAYQSLHYFLRTVITSITEPCIKLIGALIKLRYCEARKIITGNILLRKKINQLCFNPSRKWLYNLRSCIVPRKMQRKWTIIIMCLRWFLAKKLDNKNVFYECYVILTTVAF